ncbi:MAG: hypothetical protein KDA63_06825, partial [Planctomycetales bacterium]|nr:hypothetical protein [Planctomycetales bacterium]
PARPRLRVHNPDGWSSPTNAEADLAGRAASAQPSTKIPLSLAGSRNVADEQPQEYGRSTVEAFAWPAVCLDWEQAAAQSLRRTGAWLLAKMVGRHRTVAVTSCRHGEGRTSAAMMLARLGARDGRTSVVVDADVQRPHLTTQLGLQPAVGWTDAIDGTATLAETIMRSATEPIAVIPTLRPLSRLDALSDNLNIGMHLRMLREEFELVVLDVGPLEETGQTTLIKSLTDCGHVDGVLLVRDVRHTGREEADSLGECLRAAAVPVWGVIENYVGAA